MTDPMRPLEGLRVIEISAFVAAPLAGMTLSQLGADVIRIDPIGGAADRGRWPLTTGGASLYWNGLNKGKRSLVADLRSTEGRNLVRDLLAAAPTGTAVVVTNSVGQPWLSYETLREVCPDVIHVLIEGKHDGSAAVDYTVNAETGIPLVTGPPGAAEPINHVLPAWDIACGLYAALGVSSAARRRAIDGTGAGIRIALHDIALAMAGNLGFIAEAQVNKVDRARIGNHLYGGFARDFACSDGRRLMIVALTSRHWRDLVQVTGMDGPISALENALGVDFAREDDRFVYREALAGLIQSWFATRSSESASEDLAKTSIVWAPYRNFTDVVTTLSTPEGANPLMTTIDQDGIGPHLAPGLPLRFGSPVDAEPAPTMGADSREILREQLGVDDDAFAQLLTDGVVADHV